MVANARLTDDPELIDETHAPLPGGGISGAQRSVHEWNSSPVGIIEQRCSAMCELWWQEYCARRATRPIEFELCNLEEPSQSRSQSWIISEQFFEQRNFISIRINTTLTLVASDVTFEKSLPGGSERTGADHDYVGHVDVANERAIYGWAADRKRPNVPIDCQPLRRQ